MLIPINNSLDFILIYIKTKRTKERQKNDKCIIKYNTYNKNNAPLTV